MRNKTSTWIFSFLFVLTASGVFAAMVENSRQGLLAISVTSQPAFTLENPEQHQGLTCVLLNLVSGGAFTSKDPIGFNGGFNLYRYADNNPLRYIDPFGFAACYKDVVVRVINHYDKDPFSYAKATLNTAFSFFRAIPDGPQIRIQDFLQPGNTGKLGTKMLSKTWNDTTLRVLDSTMYTVSDDHNSKVANIVIANTNWQPNGIAGLTDQQVGQHRKNRALVSGNYTAHSDPYKLGWTVAHETGHVLRGLKEGEGGVMYQGSWDATEFLYEDQQEILKALTKK